MTGPWPATSALVMWKLPLPHTEHVVDAELGQGGPDRL